MDGRRRGDQEFPADPAGASPGPAGGISRPLRGAGLRIGLLLWSNPAGGRRVEGDVEGEPGLHYVWYEDETRITFTRGTGPDRQIVLTADLGADGVFRDSRQRVIGRALGDSVVLDMDALHAELPGSKSDQPDEPKLCPDPDKDKNGRDKGGMETEQSKKDKDYEDYIKKLINPENPTPRGFGYQLPNPEQGGKLVFYDDCHHPTGTLVEAKGTGYADKIASKYDFFRESFKEDWIKQARRQVAASGGRPIEWHFAEKGAAEYARNLFASTPGLERIIVVWTPWSEGSN